MPLVIISILIQLALVVHVFKTGRNITWVFILLFFPMIGGLAYLIVELIPGWMNSRSGQKLQRNIKQTIDPDRDFKEAYRNVEIAGTVSNNMKLAEQYILREQFVEAKELYEKCLTGIYKNDPVLMLGFATACFGLKDYEQTLAVLDSLKAENPDFRSQEGHLLYARAQELSGNLAAAIHEYEALINYYPGPEAVCRFALLLKANGDAERANELFTKVAKHSKNAGRHYNELHKQWVSLAKREAAT